MLFSRRLKEHLISPLTRLSVEFQKDHGNSAVWKSEGTETVPSERRVQILTSGLSVGSQGEATLIYGFSCCLKSPYGEDTKGCCHLKLVSCSHIKLPFKTGEGFCFLLSHFLRSPSQRCSRSLFYMDFLNGFLVFCHAFVVVHICLLASFSC